MSRVTTQVEQYTKVPNINQSSTFESDTNVFLNEINDRVAQGNAQATQMNSVADAINADKASAETILATVQSQAVDGGYNQLTVDLKDSNIVNAMQKSGYTKWSKKEDGFHFEESADFTYKFADKNQYLNFNGKIVDTFLNSNYDASKGGCVFDLVNHFPNVTIQDQAANGINITTAIAKDDFAVIDRTVGQVEEVYRCIQDAPIGTALTNTTYFENRDDKPISSQIACLHKLDVNGAHTLHTEVLFNDALAIETPKAIMLKNGFVEVAEGCYSKGSDLYIFVAYWQSLNDGAYHEVYNKAGTAYSTNGIDLTNRGFWEQFASMDSIANSFKFACTSSIADGSTTTTAVGGRFPNPQGKFYDIIYQSQLIDMRELAYKPTELEQKLIDEDKLFNQVNGMVSFVEVPKYQGFTYYAYSSTSTAIYMERDGDLINSFNVGDTVQAYHVSDSGNITVLSGTIETIPSVNYSIQISHPNFVSSLPLASNQSDGVCYIATQGSSNIPHNSQGQKLSADLIGSPSNYPSMITDRLAEGKGLFGLYPLLVGQDGANYLDGRTLNNMIFKDKIDDKLQTLKFDTIGLVWSEHTTTLNTTGNTVNETVSTTDRLILQPYTSQNTIPQIDPLPILDVIEKVEASNSHSIYKGAVIGNSIGKIQTGNGTKGFVSKYLEDSTPNLYDYDDTIGGGLGVVINDIMLCTGINTTGISGHYYKFNSTISGANRQTIDLSANASDIGTFGAGTPTHNAINLDNSSSTASKWFKCYAKDSDNYLWVYIPTEQITHDGISEWGDTDFSQLTNGTIPDVNGGSDVITKIVGYCTGVRV